MSDDIALDPPVVPEQAPETPTPVVTETRDILDSEGAVKGSISLPEGTSEEVWAERMAAYNVLPNLIPDVTPRQIRQALVLSGVSLEQIVSALESLPEPYKTLAKVEWEYSNAFQRKRPLVEQVGVMLGWTSQQVDNLWYFASTL